MLQDLLLLAGLLGGVFSLGMHLSLRAAARQDGAAASHASVRPE